MGLFSDKILKWKKALFFIGTILYLFIYLVITYIFIFDLNNKIYSSKGLFSFGAHTVEGWFWSMSTFNLLLFIVWIRKRTSPF